MLIMALASQGYGSPEVLANERVDLVMDAFEYMTYLKRHEQIRYQRANDGRG